MDRKARPKWDERIIDWDLFETRFLGIQARTVRSKVSAIRYWAVLSGFPDFPKWDGRYKQVLKIAPRRNVAKRNYPFNLELLHLADIGLGHIEERSAHDKAVYSALTVGFSACSE